jgi:hypothetical protein
MGSRRESLIATRPQYSETLNSIKRIEAVSDGRPFLSLEEESREAVAELLAEMLVGAMEREGWPA